MQLTYRYGSPMRSFASSSLLLITVLPILSVMGCETERAPSTKANTDVGSPFLFIWRFPPYPRVGERARAGLVCAVWDVGSVVRISGPDGVGYSYVAGRLNTEDRAFLENLVARHLSFAQTHSVDKLVEDAGAEYLYVRLPGGIRSRGSSLPLSDDSPIKSIEVFLLQAALTETRQAPDVPKAIPRQWAGKDPL